MANAFCVLFPFQMVQAIQVLRFHLLELEKVSETLSLHHLLHIFCAILGRFHLNIERLFYRRREESVQVVKLTHVQAIFGHWSCCTARHGSEKVCVCSFLLFPLPPLLLSPLDPHTYIWGKKRKGE